MKLHAAQSHPGRRAGLQSGNKRGWGRYGFLIVLTSVASTLSALAVVWWYLTEDGIAALLRSGAPVAVVLAIVASVPVLLALTRQSSSRLESRLEKFRWIADQANDSIVLLDPSLRIIFANQAALRLCGMPEAALLGHHAANFLPDDVARQLGAHVEELTRVPFLRREWTIRHAQGRLIQVLATTQRLPNGFYLAIASDMSAVRQAQSEVELERQRLRTLLDAIPDPIWFKDTAGAYLACNPAVESLLALAEHQIVHRTDGEIHPEIHADDFIQQDQQVIGTRTPLKLLQTYRSPNGRLRYFDTVKLPVLRADGSVEGVLGIARDITAEHEAHEALAASERRFRTLFDAAPDGICIVDLDGQFRGVNRRTCDMLGYSEQELLGMHLRDIETALSFEQIQKLWQTETFQSPLSLRGRAKRKDGSILPVEVHIRRFELDGRAHSLGFVRDISAQEAAEASIKSNEAFSRAVLNSSTSLMAVLDWDGTVVATNDAWARFASASDLSVQTSRIGVGTNFLDVCRVSAQSGAEQAQAAAEGVLAVRDGRVDSFTLECPCETPAGMRWFMMNVNPVGVAGGNVVVSYVDVTAVKSAQKMEHHLALQFKALAKARLDIQEAERHHLSMELHDNVGQSLTALKIALESCRGAFTSGRPVDTILGDASRIAEAISDSIHSIARKLRPPLLDELGLAIALRSHVETLAFPKVRVCLQETIGPRRFSHEVELACFRVAQEALSNSIQHAGASEIVINLELVQGELSLSVSDDGKGFDVHKITSQSPDRASLGLLGMSERAAGVGGSFSIRSIQPAGTVVSARFPTGNPP